MNDAARSSAKMLDDLALVFSHEKLQEEIKRRYRLNPRPRMEIVAELWGETIPLDKSAAQV